MKEAARYLGVKKPDELTEKYIKECEETASVLVPSFVYAAFDIETTDGILLKGADVLLPGKLAKNHFSACKKIIVVLATLGLKSEVLLKRTFALSSAKGVVLDAVYTAKIEEFLDEVEVKLADEYGEVTSRISCGYGDLPFSLQRELFALVEGEKLGVKMNDCLMLTPNKSVIALMGVK